MCKKKVHSIAFDLKSKPFFNFLLKKASTFLNYFKVDKQLICIVMVV